MVPLLGTNKKVARPCRAIFLSGALAPDMAFHSSHGLVCDEAIAALDSGTVKAGAECRGSWWSRIEPFGARCSPACGRGEWLFFTLMVKIIL